ncbi:hypothetical protein [Desulfosporosinus sp. OT]|uniref:hypothetical protein n=1 Tax=Desulfosporosinus sp. OT TaxID=913865 RepID=UPI001111A351|nr:hypothetical protein [Desulfosporosinus sp. OT]
MTQTGRLRLEHIPKTLSSHLLAFLQDGIAFDQNSPEVLRFSLSDKRIANEACANTIVSSTIVSSTIVSSGEYRRSRDP